MLRSLLWLLVLGAFAAGLALAASYNDGYVLLVLPRWGRVEMSLNLLLVLALFGFVVFYLIARSLGALFALPASVREYRARRMRDNAERGLHEAINLAMEGRFSRALRLAEASYHAGHAPLLSALIAERAAHGMRDLQRETTWRERAEQADIKGTSGARLMTQAEIALEKHEFEQARLLLDQFAAAGGRHVMTQRLALRAYQGLGRWQDVLRVVRQLEKHHAMTADQAASLRHRAQRERIRQLNDQGPALIRYLRDLPNADRRDPSLVLVAVPALMAIPEYAEAARLIEDALDSQWNSDLAALYASCAGGDVLVRISRAERWLDDHPRDGQLLLTLGRLCQRQQLWGKAQSYLDASLSTRPSREAHLELAKLFDQLEQPERANAHYRSAAKEFR
jgi:HemY protein